MVPCERWGDPALADYNGMVVSNPSAAHHRTGPWRRDAAAGPIEQADQTWVNGRPVGAAGSGDRAYPSPSNSLRRGLNTIVVNVLDTYAKGGLCGPAELLTNGGDIALGFKLFAAGDDDCRYAPTTVKGSDVWIEVPPGFPAAVVRYGWADNRRSTCSTRRGCRLGRFRR